MRISKVVFLLLIVYAVGLISCNRSITPFEAANGKARCGRGVR